MAKANALDTSVVNSSGLPLATGVTGNILVTNLSSGTGASSSTYYNWNGWGNFPKINAGSQNSMAYYSAFETVSPVTKVANAVFFTGPVPYWAPMLDGQIAIGNTSASAFTVANFGSANGMVVTNGSNSVNFSYAIPTIVNTTTSVTMAVNQSYICNNASLVTLTLPAVSAVGSFLYVSSSNTGNWRVAQKAGQSIKVSASTTTTGVTGYIESTSASDTVYLICIVANATWLVATAPQSSGLTIV